MTQWILPSIPPHDWTLCLDIESYFDHEHDIERISDEGFIRPIRVGDRGTVGAHDAIGAGAAGAAAKGAIAKAASTDGRDVAVKVFFNGDPEHPEFHIHCEEDLSKAEIEDANRSLSRILGTELDTRPLYDQASEDRVLGPILTELYGFKRMARASLFEDILNRIVEMRMAHKPTARKMMYKLREAYASTVSVDGRTLAGWPRPTDLMGADPARIRSLGPTLRKGEYIAGLSSEIVGGVFDMGWLDRQASPQEFLQEIAKIRGIGPSASQDLMLYRPRTDAHFPSTRQKGQETGLRKWVLLSYGRDPDTTSDAEFERILTPWRGQESAGIEFLYANWVMNHKKRRMEGKG